MFASVGQLIRQAYIYAQVLAPEENLTQDGSGAVNLNIGLQLFNELILTNNLNGNNWSLIDNSQFTVSPGDDTLTLDGYAHIFKIRFLLGNVWFTILEENLNNFLDKAILPSSSGVPFVMFPQRTVTGYLLRFFQPANQNYTFDVWGYLQFSTFTTPNDPLTALGTFYETYFLYELAYRIQNYYQVPYTPFILEQRQVLKNQLSNLKQRRVERQFSRTSQLGSRQFSSISALNLSQGYSP